MSDLTEREVYARLIESIRTAEECSRCLAHMRNDLRWIAVGKNFALIIHKVTDLAMGRTAA